VDLEEFEALLRRPHAGAAPHGDPLAELARLVEGQRAPFVKAQTPEAQPAAGHGDWDLRGSTHDVHPDARGSYEQMNSGRERAPSAYEQDPYAQNAYSQPSPVPPPPPGAWRQEDAVWESDVEPKRRSRTAIYALGGALCLVVAGVAGTYAFRSGPAIVASAPTIKAASGPLKVVPEGPAPSSASPSSATVLDKAGEKIGASRVVTSEEQPVDLSQVRTATIPAAGAPAKSGNGFPEPIKVKTVSVRPDGTIIQPGAPAPQRTASNVTGSTPPAVSAAAPAAPVAPPAVVAPAPAPAAGKTTVRVTPPSETPAPRPVQTASVAPAVGSTPAVAKGGFAVQLSAAGSENEARASIAKYQRQFGSALGSHSPGVVKGEANGRDVWRIRVGGLSREDALSMCTSIKGSGGSCFVAAN
jgi:hypothetical protein